MMQIERKYNNETTLTLDDILMSLVDEKIDSLILEYYDNARVNTVASHNEGTIVV